MKRPWIFNRDRDAKLEAVWSESVELRGLIQQTNAALAELRADHEKLLAVTIEETERQEL